MVSMMGSPNDNKNGQWVVYYDGDCGLCVVLQRWLSRVDFFNKTRWVTSQSLETPPGGLSWSDLDRAAYLETPSGRLYEGFYAFRMLALRILPLMPLAPVLWVPGLDRVGTVVYRWVATNRRRISRCGNSQTGSGIG